MVATSRGHRRTARPLPPDDDADYRDLFYGQFAAMTRLAAMLGADDPEDVAQEAFVRLHRPHPHPARPARRRSATCGTTVVNLTRSRLRHLAVVRRHAAGPRRRRRQVPAPSTTPYAARATTSWSPRCSRLSPRHREALVLRYWLDLTEAEMAEAMGVSRGTVKSHVSRGLDALAAELEARR